MVVGSSCVSLWGMLLSWVLCRVFTSLLGRRLSQVSWRLPLRVQVYLSLGLGVLPQ